MTIAADDKGNLFEKSDTGEWVPAKVGKTEGGTPMVQHGGKWVPVPGQETTAAGAALRGFGQGASFGFSDELGAGADAAIQGVKNLLPGPPGPSMGEAYDASLTHRRELLKMDQEAHPYASMAGNIPGAIGSAIAAPVGPVLRAAGPVVSAVGRFAAPVTDALPGIVNAGLKYAGIGGAAGGLAGFGEGEGGVGNRLEGAATGAATGAVVAPVIGGLVSAVPRAVGATGQALGLRDPNVAADRQIIRSLDRGGVTIDQAEARLGAAGDQPTALVDVGGRNTVNLGATAANTPSTAMDVADAFVESRRAGRPDRLMNAGDQAFGGGSGGDVAQTTAALKAQRSAEASPLYQEALGQPAGFNDRMAGVLEDPIAQQGLRKGLEIQRIENASRRARGEAEVPTTDPTIHFDENGDPRIVGVPNMRTLDAVKRGMDSIIESARDSTTGRVQWTERLRAIDDLRKTWVGLLDEGNPVYAKARAAWGGPSAQMEATDAGRKAFRTDRDIVAQRAQQGPPDVQEAYRLGAGRDFADRVSDPASASGVARKLLEDTQMQDRLRSLMSPDDFAKLNDALRRETAMTAVERAVGPRAGSQTARLTAGAADMGRDVAGPWMTAANQLLGGHALAATGTVAKDVGRRIFQGVTADTADALANRLFVTDPTGRLQVTQALRNRLVMDEVARQRAQQVMQPLLGGIGAASGAANVRQ